MDTGDMIGLVNKAKQKDQDALLQLIMEQKQEYYKLAYIYMRNKDDALDAMEDMVLILYENIHKLKKAELFYSWSKTILVNCCRNNLRKMKKLVAIDEITEGSYEGEYHQKDERLLIEEYLSGLDKKHQEVLRLRYFLDMDYQAIADILKIPLGTVKSRISIGLKKLKSSMEGEYNEGC